MVFERLGTTV